jgi:hypothetical protein
MDVSLRRRHLCYMKSRKQYKRETFSNKRLHYVGELYRVIQEELQATYGAHF